MEGKLPFVNGTIVGHYRVSIATGLTTTLLAGDPVFSARWTSAAGIRAALLRLKVQANIITPFTNAQEVAAAATVARAWTVADSAGSAVVLTGSNAMQNSLADAASIAQLRVSGAAALTAGTRTLDANPFLQLSNSQLLAAATAAGVPYAAEYGVSSEMQFPFNFNSIAPLQEGFVVSNAILQGAAGTVRYIIDMEWVEYQGAANVGSLA